MKVVQFLRGSLPETHLILLGLLPKGGEWPNLVTPLLEDINSHLKAAALLDHSFMHYHDCGGLFIQKSKKYWPVQLP